MPKKNALPEIYLASTSSFRKMLLQKLQIPFKTEKPEIDETSLPSENIESMIERLSLAKARKIADQYDNAIIIGSDQSAIFKGKPVGKPHTHENAVKQLQSFSGKKIEFLTGLAVIDNRAEKSYYCLDRTFVHFRELTGTEIQDYLKLEQPYQCAGSFKSEGLGITLFSKIETSDPNALIGLPLIKLCNILRSCNISLPYRAD